MKYMVLSFSFLFLFIQCASSFGQNPDYNSAQLIEYLDSNDAHSRAIGFSYFNKAVSDVDKAAKLEEIWSLAGNNPEGNQVRKSIAAYYVTYPEKTAAWSPLMQAHIQSLASDKDASTRRLCLNALATRGEEDVSALIIRFLEDDEPMIRELALIQVSKWSEGKKILQDYIQRNEQRPAFDQSLNKARFLLQKMTKKNDNR